MLRWFIHFFGGSFQLQKFKSRKLLLGNIHVLYNPNKGDVKLGQVSLDILIGRYTSGHEFEFTKDWLGSVSLRLHHFYLADLCFSFFLLN